MQASVRFGPFEVSCDSGELRKNGKRVKVSGQAIDVLVLLLDSQGRVVTREELQERLWPGATFGDFEHGLNAAVNRLREVLGDSASKPRYIETVPRRGYRFITQGEPPAAHTTEPHLPFAVIQDPATRRPRPWVLLLLAGVLLFVFVGSYILLHKRSTSSQELKVIPFTTYPGYEASPSFSPDGNQIVFSWYPQEQSGKVSKGDLYVKQIGEENAVRLTRHEADFLFPAWAPDGRNIAFAMVGKDGNGIYLIPSLGGRERHLVELKPNSWQWLLLSWLPDSKWLAFASDSPASSEKAGEPYRIHLLNVETGEQRILPDPAPDCAMTIEPAISPDGKYLASVCVLSVGLNRLYVQQMDGKASRELAQIETSYVLAGTAWSADGRSILYSTYGTTGRLWRVAAEGGRPEPLPLSHGMQSPAVARAGNRLAFMQTNYHFDIWSMRLGARQSGARPAKFISSTWDQANPQISPDGRLIAFDSSRSGNYEIWICDRDGTRLQQLSFFAGPQTGNPRWSPDGKAIVFTSTVSGQVGSYSLPVEGGRAHSIVTGTGNALWPFWSRDGRWIYFATKQPDGIWKIPSAGGAAIRLTKEGAYPQESSDGKRIFYIVGDSNAELWSAASSGGDEHREKGMPTLLNSFSWAPVQNGIYFIDGSPSHLAVRYFDFSTRQAQLVSELQGISFLCCGIALSGTNDTLFFSGLDNVESDIMLAENFR